MGTKVILVITYYIIRTITILYNLNQSYGCVSSIVFSYVQKHAKLNFVVKRITFQTLYRMKINNRVYFSIKIQNMVINHLQMNVYSTTLWAIFLREREMNFRRVTGEGRGTL